MGGSTLLNCYILHIRFILLGKIRSGLETNSTFQVMFSKFLKVDTKDCSVPPCFEKNSQFSFSFHT